LRGIYKEVIDWINQAAGKKVSVDIPSGLNADNGEVGSVAVRADLTVTMELRKIGLIVYQGMTCTGELEVVDIGIPREVVSNNRADTYVVREEDVRRILPSRTPRAHKHSVGKIFILAGSRGLTGAAAMASSSAMRAGAGAVVLGTPVSVYPILAKKVTEVMVEPLPETPDGTLAASSYDIIQKHLQWADILILGPGISRNSETSELVWQLVSQCDKPMLIDADGLNILSQKLSILKKHGRKEIIITPHTGELSRLIGMPSEEIERDRVEIARKVARQFTLTLVLKGAPTVTASEDGKVYINSTGNPGMATAGSGDVLAGLIGGLWAQGMKRTEAAYAGVFLHGLAGDRARQVFGEKSLMATDIQEQLPKVLLDLEGGQCG
ncbi:MAG: NAD(P)H-hydrate dehydratase, partial [Ignavibacteriales bacterium]|nr:NAD(P)H-hydrate dehydratase [Ignavibacteriales bacterium]